MRTLRNLACTVVLTVPMAVVLAATPAAAHGAMDSPISRSYVCYQEGPENPASDVCADVIAAGGTQPLYDWMEVNIANAAGRHRELIPDGQLCSAGRVKYRGLDLARSDWPATSLPAGEPFTFRYRATAPHQGGFEFYITRDGYDPTEPLAWDDLESEPFHVEPSPQLVDGYYLMDATLPDKQGRHLIYAIWQRTDSPEAFYSCSDVDFGGGSDGSGGSGGAGGSGGSGGAGGADGAGGSGGSDDPPAPGTCAPVDDAVADDPTPAHGNGGESGDDQQDGDTTAPGHDHSGGAGGDHGRYGYWQALIEWFERIREWAGTSPRLADDAVLTSSIVPTSSAAGDTGGSTSQILAGVAAAIGAALLLARPALLREFGRGRYRWLPAHRR